MLVSPWVDDIGSMQIVRDLAGPWDCREVAVGPPLSKKAWQAFMSWFFVAGGVSEVLLYLPRIFFCLYFCFLLVLIRAFLQAR